MKISIIIPIFNVATFIERCLLSALDQTWEDLEVILVNDCTPDNSMSVVEDILEAHPRASIVKIVNHLENKGLSATRNTGIRESIGDYLFFLDSDDYLPLDSIKILAIKAEEYAADFVVGDCKIVGGSKSVPPLALPTCFLETNQEILSTYAKSKWPVMAWNKLINHDFLVEHNLFFQEGIVHEDDLWTFVLACKAEKAFVVHDITYFYYVQPNSITGKPSMRNLECRVFIIQFICEYVISLEQLKQKKWVYITFETMKAKYFDRIIYFTNDEEFRFKAYQIFRNTRYISPIKALFKFHPNMKLVFRNIHYLLPLKIGYLYFKIFVKLSYYFLVFPVKFKQWMGSNR